MSVICKCDYCNALFPSLDIKLKEAVYSVIENYEGDIQYWHSGLQAIVEAPSSTLIGGEDKTLHCPICEALHLNGFENV